jgi:sugar lactone lactonase YvrE
LRVARQHKEDTMNRTAWKALSLAWIWIPALLAGCWDDGNNAPVGHTIGGTIAGLSAAGLVLADGTDSVSPTSGASSFTFPASVADGVAYAVTVATQPAGETCSVSRASGTLSAADVVDIQVVCAPTGFTVGGPITGLTGAGLVLANGTDRLAVSATATGFTLPTPVAQGAAYAVTVQTQPAGEQCSLSQSTGTINGANVTNVGVACAAVTHTLGGTISGLTSSGLALANGSDALSPGAGSLAFTFALPVAEGGAYAVSVRTQPSGESCSVGSGAGTMGSTDVGTVAITCSATAYRVGGAIAGLTGAGLILTNGTDTVSPANGATSYVFTNRVAFGGTYSVMVQQQPAGLTCAVAGSFPATMGATDVTNADVTCAPATGLQLVAGQLSCPVAAPSVDGHDASASVPAGEGMVFDALGNLYVTGQGSKTVRKVTPAGDVTTIAGQYGTGGSVDGTGSAARFVGPQGIALDPSGNLYVGDSLAMRLVTQAGFVTTLAGMPFVQGFVDGTGSAARFGGIRNIVADTAGNAYVADANNNVIRKMTPAGVITTFAGGGGGTASGFVDGTGTAARFAAPGGLTIDAAGNIYVADYLNWSIRKITPAGVVTTLAGGGPTNPGFADGVGAAARFGGSSGLAMAPGGGIYVLDQGFAAVRLVSAAGVVTTLGNSGLPPTGPISPTTFTWPQVAQVPGIGADPSGKLVLSAGCAVLQVGP